MVEKYKHLWTKHEAPDKKYINPLSADHDYCRFYSVLLVD